VRAPARSSQKFEGNRRSAVEGVVRRGAKILARRQAPILYVVSGFSRTVIAVAATR
jgi:hypothetical protein